MHRRCQSQVVKSCRDGGAGVRERRSRGGPSPEICQKLRYAQPRIAPRLDPRQRFTCSVAWVGEVAHGDVNHRRIDGKDGVAGSIPAEGSTTNHQLRPGPAPTYRGRVAESSVTAAVVGCEFGHRGV